MTLTPEQEAAGLAAADKLKERGDGPGCYPVSFTKNPRLYVQRIGEAVLAAAVKPARKSRRMVCPCGAPSCDCVCPMVPEPKQSRSKKA